MSKLAPRTVRAQKPFGARPSRTRRTPRNVPAWTTRSKKAAIAGTFATLALSLVNGMLAAADGSAWFALLACTYAVLGAMRVPAIVRLSGRGGRRGSPVRPICGIGMVALLPIVAAMVLLLAVESSDTGRGEILMIATSAYVFGELAFAVVNAVRARSRGMEALVALRDCSCAAAAISMLSLQHSMVATFGEAGGSFAFVLDVCCGAGAFFAVLLLGAFAIRATPAANEGSGRRDHGRGTRSARSPRRRSCRR